MARTGRERKSAAKASEEGTGSDVADVARTAFRSGSVKVADLMHRDVVSVPPGMPVRELAQTLARHGVTGVPVIDDGRAVGMVSSTDLLWLFDPVETGASGRPRTADIDRLTVRDIMTPDVFGVPSSAGLHELRQFFTRTAVHRALVLEDEAVVGIVSITDMLALL
jgi:CBS domain-containing protein